MKKSYLLIAAALVAILAGVTAFTMIAPPATESEMNKSSNGKVKVVATFFPMYDHVKNVGGDRVDVSILLPPGQEIHDWDPTPEQITRVADAKVIVYNGAGLEPFIDKILQVAGSKVVAVDTSEGIALLPLEEGGSDPHIWLDPGLAKKQVLNIRDGLISADPAGKAIYEKNAADYITKLDALDAKIKDALSKTQKKEFVAFHEAFSYFANRYGLTQYYLLKGLAEEPAPGDIVKIIGIIKEKNVKILFYEPNFDPRILEQVANTIPGTKLLPLDPIENPVDAIKLGKTYIGLMEENLNALLQALQ